MRVVAAAAVKLLDAPALERLLVASARFIEIVERRERLATKSLGSDVR
jgi:hypothetical protein